MNELTTFRSILLYFFALLVAVFIAAPVAYFAGPWKIVTVYIPILIIGMFVYIFIGVLRNNTDNTDNTMNVFTLREQERHNGTVELGKQQTGTKK